MTDAVLEAGGGKAKPARHFIKRHALIVRISHWINVVALLFMLLSGLQIFNAHPALYWGKAADFDHPWLAAHQVGKKGITFVGPYKIDTTGVFGYSHTVHKVDGKVIDVWEDRGFPDWATIPWYRSLAEGRNWHLFFAWVFAINGLIYLVSGLITRHITRDLLPTPKDLTHIGKDVVDHLKLKFPKGKEAARYQVLQRIAYSGTALIVLPLIVLTGLTMSPAMNAAFPFLLDLFGGRQSARSIHFICMALIVAFIFVHLVMVILSGPINQIRGMITGNIAIEEEAGQ